MRGEVLPGGSGFADAVWAGSDLTSAILLAGHLMELRVDDALRARDLTVRQYRVLRHIAGHPRVTRVELAKALCISRQTAGGISQRLRNAGLIDRDSDCPGWPVHFTLTDSGRSHLDLASPLVAIAEQDILVRLPYATASVLVAVIHELITEMA
jgi:DNA-binding MarR family transcriptional regulator